VLPLAGRLAVLDRSQTIASTSVFAPVPIEERPECGGKTLVFAVAGERTNFFCGCVVVEVVQGLSLLGTHVAAMGIPTERWRLAGLSHSLGINVELVGQLL